MPISVKKRGSKYVVTDGNEVYGRHATKSKAEKQRKAIYASKNKRK